MRRARHIAAMMALAAVCVMGQQTGLAEAAGISPNGGTSMQADAAWDKTFPKSGTVAHRKVRFKNRYGIELAGDLYIPESGGKNRRPSPCADLLARSRNRHQGCMPRQWPNVAF